MLDDLMTSSYDAFHWMIPVAIAWVLLMMFLLATANQRVARNQRTTGSSYGAVAPMSGVVPLLGDIVIYPYGSTTRVGDIDFRKPGISFPASVVQGVGPVAAFNENFQLGWAFYRPPITFADGTGKGFRFDPRSLDDTFCQAALTSTGDYRAPDPSLPYHGNHPLYANPEQRKVFLALIGPVVNVAQIRQAMQQAVIQTRPQGNAFPITAAAVGAAYVMHERSKTHEAQRQLAAANQRAIDAQRAAEATQRQQAQAAQQARVDKEVYELNHRYPMPNGQSKTGW